MKRAIFLLSAVILWTGCGFIDNARVIDAVLDTYGDAVVEPCFDLVDDGVGAVDDFFGNYDLEFWPISFPAYAAAVVVPGTAGVALGAPPVAAAVVVDEGMRFVEVAPAAWRDASGFFRWSGASHNILIHRAALVPRAAAMPVVYGVSHLVRWVVPIDNGHEVFNQRNVPISPPGGG